MQSAIIFLFLTITVVLIKASPSPSMYLDYDSIVDQGDTDAEALPSDRVMYSAQVKRSCLPRGAICGRRALSCCYGECYCIKRVRICSCRR